MLMLSQPPGSKSRTPATAFKWLSKLEPITKGWKICCGAVVSSAVLAFDLAIEPTTIWVNKDGPAFYRGGTGLQSLRSAERDASPAGAGLFQFI